MTAVPLNLTRWIEDHRADLRPPVGNRCVHKGEDFLVMAVGGPNARKDYHVDPFEEYFHQIEGDLVLRILEDGKPRDLVVREGETLLLPRNIPHSPQRGPGTVGLVIERIRGTEDIDGFLWVCEACSTPLHEVRFPVSDIETQLAEAFSAYWEGPVSRRTCAACGLVMQPPGQG